MKKYKKPIWRRCNNFFSIFSYASWKRVKKNILFVFRSYDRRSNWLCGKHFQSWKEKTKQIIEFLNHFLCRRKIYDIFGWNKLFRDKKFYLDSETAHTEEIKIINDVANNCIALFFHCVQCTIERFCYASELLNEIKWFINSCKWNNKICKRM